MLKMNGSKIDTWVIPQKSQRNTLQYEFWFEITCFQPFEIVKNKDLTQEVKVKTLMK